MDHDGFVAIVQEWAGGIDRVTAERAARATLQTLAERITAGEADDIAAQLPEDLAAWLATDGAAEPFDVDEFLRRVALREGTNVETAERHARAVFVALWKAVGESELKDLTAQLSKDYWSLLPFGPHVEIMPADVFLHKVAERARTDLEGARRASDAVLETLAERIAAGEVDDLLARLAIQLRPPLKRGRGRRNGLATRMSLDEFVQRVAQREGVDVDTAREHTRAVLVTLREAVGDDEFFDVTVQLPHDYFALMQTT